MTSTPLTEHKITGAFAMTQPSEAALLLIRDLTPETPHEAATPPAAPAADTPAAPQPMFPLMPVADVLITERRICKACGSISEAQSDRVHRLLSSCEGDPFKRVLRPRKADEFPLDMRLMHTVEVRATHCACCWQPTHAFWEAVDIRPKRPTPRRIVPTERIMTPSSAKAEREKRQEFNKKLAAMPLKDALDFL